ncbi:hypothetical protein F4809DRAFT_465360 [Biscogniauxia mediterranea]|nr:hypothetical protein F4809DRAFT_465360 [Biscogniauxia mediterranea]
MPKRKKHRKSSSSVPHSHSHSQPKHPPRKPRKPKPDPDPDPPLPPDDALASGSRSRLLLTLGDRFRLLPSELRASVFAQLVVAPVKWSARHNDTAGGCALLAAAHPFSDVRPTPTGAGGYICAYQHVRGTAGQWRAAQVEARVAWTDPWRSAWAPAQRNAFVCAACYDEWLRPRLGTGPVPETHSLPCLCARGRRELQVLLVCRAWYAEAGAVLYGANTFAFAHPRECVGFFRALAPRWRRLVSKVSLLALAPPGVFPQTADADTREVEVDGRALKKAWSVLASLPALSELELDAIFLTRQDCVKVLRGPALKNLRRITFTQGMPFQPMRAPKEFVWPRRGCRIAVEDSDFVSQVAREIKGLRYGWTKGKKGKAYRQAAEEEKKRYCERFGSPGNDKKESDKNENENET